MLSNSIESQEDFKRKSKSSSIYWNTYKQVTTRLSLLKRIWQRTTEKDALIGVSMTGIGSGAVLIIIYKSSRNC
jgi:hypothetical protein